MARHNDDFQLAEDIEGYIDKNPSMTYLVTLSTLHRHMKLADEIDLAQALKEAMNRLELGWGNRALTLIEELREEEED